jgi:hypothetical protein
MLTASYGFGSGNDDFDIAVRFNQMPQIQGDVRGLLVYKPGTCTPLLSCHLNAGLMGPTSWEKDQKGERVIFVHSKQNPKEYLLNGVKRRIVGLNTFLLNTADINFRVVNDKTRYMCRFKFVSHDVENSNLTAPFVLNLLNCSGNFGSANIIPIDIVGKPSPSLIWGTSIAASSVRKASLIMVKVRVLGARGKTPSLLNLIQLPNILERVSLPRFLSQLRY